SGGAVSVESSEAPPPVISGEEPASLTTEQARNFLAGCSDKVKQAIKTAVSNGDRFFKIAQIAKTLNVAPSSLRGVWTGITKRTGTILGDRSARLIWWEDDARYAPDGTYLDQTGRLSQQAYDSFRRAFGM